MTPLQLAILDDVREMYAQGGLSPTVRSVAKQHKLSVSGAHRVLSWLVDRGYLERVAGAQQGLRPVGAPDLRGVPTDTLHAELARRGVTLAALNPRTPKAYGQRAAHCAAENCGAGVQRGHLMCREHWFRVPGDLRDAIMRSFGARDARGYQDAVAEARDVLSGFGRWGDRERAA